MSRVGNERERMGRESVEYFGNDKTHEGGFLVALQDKSGAGKADTIERFGGTEQTGDHGGTGIEQVLSVGSRCKVQGALSLDHEVLCEVVGFRDNVALLMPCLRQRSAVFIPASCSRKIPMI